MQLEKGLIFINSNEGQTERPHSKHLNKLKHEQTFFSPIKKIIQLGSDGELTEQPLTCTVPTRCSSSEENQTPNPHHGVRGGH